MKKLKKLRIPLITCLSVVGVMIFCFVFLHFYADTATKVASIEVWLSKHTSTLLIWRLILFVVFSFVVYPLLLKKHAKQGQWTDEQLKLRMRYRWYIFLCLLGMDLLFNLGRIL